MTLRFWEYLVKKILLGSDKIHGTGGFEYIYSA